MSGDQAKAGRRTGSPTRVFGNDELRASWLASWELLGTAAPPGALEALLGAWDEPHRHYHDVRHLRECMALWAEWREYCSHPGEVGIALWYHDAVYFPKGGDNERRSAAWAASDLRAAGVGQHSVARIEGLVMATCHDAQAEGLDAQVLVDIDLAILGSAPGRFEQSSQDIRKEYDWVPAETYRLKRAEMLTRFAARHRIYNTTAAIARFEAQAKDNLSAAIRTLRES